MSQEAHGGKNALIKTYMQKNSSMVYFSLLSIMLHHGLQDIISLRGPRSRTKEYPHRKSL